jgi:hypothetical protein
MALTVAVAALAAICFAVASVLQHSGAMAARRRSPVDPGLLAELARKPRWLLGVAAQASGVTLHLVAVNLGALSVVQPVLTFGLVVALVLQRLTGRAVTPKAMLSAAAVVCGLALFLVFTPPDVAAAPTDAAAWTPGLALSGTLLAVTLGAGLARPGVVRCVALGAAAGVSMASSAALAKAWGGLLRADGIVGLATSWQLWAGLACGAAGMWLTQAAFHAGPLGSALAPMMAVDPAVGVGLGIVVFGEPFATPGRLGVRCLGLAVTVVAVWMLARFQRVGHSPEHPPQHVGSPPRGYR